MKEFDKVIGYEPIKKELERIIDMMNNPEKYYSLGAKTTNGLLFEGEPGLGKTLMAKCFIEASKRKAFTIRKDKPDGDFINYIKDVFDKAKKEAPSIVFLDDLDKYANEDRNHRNAEEFVTIQACIDDCKEDEVFVLATANDLGNIPDSLIREGRFDKKISFESPEEKDVKEIVKYYLSDKKVSNYLDYESIARLLYGRSCATLETVINEAGIYAAFDDRKEIGMNDIVRSYLRIVYGSPEEESDKRKKYERNIAVHECGHAVVSEVLNPKSINLISLNTDHSYYGGLTSYKVDHDYLFDIEHTEYRIIIALAGKAATEVVYGKADMGCDKDVEIAYDLTSDMLCSKCTNGFKNYLERRKTPDKEIQGIIASEMERYYQIAKRIIVENRTFLDILVSHLVRNKVILYKEIQEIKSLYQSHLQMEGGED